MWPSSSTTSTSQAENVLSGQEVPLLAHTASVDEVLQLRLSGGGTGTRNKSLEESSLRPRAQQGWIFLKQTKF